MKALLNNIYAGLHDENLDALQRAIRDRKDRLAYKSVGEIGRGSIMQFNSKTNPQYLRGQKVEVIKVNRRRYKVKLQTPIGRFGSKNINCPFDLLERVSA